MRNKIKFSNRVFSAKLLKIGRGHLEIVENPTPYSDPPDGSYLIRGEKKYSYKEYAKTGGIWYLLRTIDDSLDYYYIIAAKFNIHPHLTDKEWVDLIKFYSKLSPYWKRMVKGRADWGRFREIERNARRTRLKLLGR